MGKLTGLDGVKGGEIDCKFFSKETELHEIIGSGWAATAAGNCGAINIWQSDNGIFFCEKCVHLVTEEKVQYKSFNDVVLWARKNLKLIIR